MLCGMLLRRSPWGFGPLSVDSQETRPSIARASAGSRKRVENFMEIAWEEKCGSLGAFEDHLVAGLHFDTAHERVIDDVGDGDGVFEIHDAEAGDAGVAALHEER